MKILNKEYICKQLWLIENELEDIYNTMTEHGFDLTSDDVIDLMYKVNTRVENIKRELKNNKDTNRLNYKQTLLNMSKEDILRSEELLEEK